MHSPYIPPEKLEALRKSARQPSTLEFFLGMAALVGGVLAFMWIVAECVL